MYTLIKRQTVILICSVLCLSVYAEIPPTTTNFLTPERGEESPGGQTSTLKRGKRAFLQSAANLSFERRLDFKIGQSIFDKLWVFSPSSTQASDGLGPLHNARSCMGCHINGGRGHVPKGNWPIDTSLSMLMRLSIPAQNTQHQSLLDSKKVAFIAEPTYGAQLQEFALQGLNAEGRIHISYTEKTLVLADGSKVLLRAPQYKIVDLGYGALHPLTRFSVRIANPMHGLGLLEAIESADILSLADPDDSDANGISGRANKVWEEASQSTVLGRFGWKAGDPSVDQQNSAAFATDMGLSTALFKSRYSGDCTSLQISCINAPDGRSAHLANVEVAPQMSDALLVFVRNIAVPKRVNVSAPAVLAGKAVFYKSGCAACHQPSFITSDTAEKEQASQLIWPYTDMLLHDMGEGLADKHPEFEARGFEWRTAPLWGIGATAKVSGKTEFLHDGRARSLMEAIFWHGGEAEQSSQKVQAMNKLQRDQLVVFLESL